MSRNSGIRPIFSQIVLATIIVVFLALSVRMVYINYRMGDQLRARARQQQQGFRPISSIRGTIYDRRGRILAGTKIVPSLFADPSIMQDQARIADIVSAVLQLREETVFSKIVNDNSKFVWLARDIPPQKADGLMRLDLRGLRIRNEPKRMYTAGTLAGHVLGTVDIDGKGIEGLEYYHDRILRGTDGRERFMSDVNRRKIWQIESECSPPVNGNHIIISIDAVIQLRTQQILAETCQKYQAESGVAVVMDPRTGDILAMASWPEVDPNQFGQTPVAHRRNRVLTDPYEPGSIFKPFVAAYALSQGVVRFDETIFCHNGTYQVGRRTLRDVNPYGDMTFSDILIKSSNIGMGIIGQRLGNEKLHEAVRAFGFGSRTGIDLHGEDSGIVLPLRRWTSYSTLSVPMGQEIATTSLQLVTAFAALANDGLLVQPRLFRAAIDERGEMIENRMLVEVKDQAVEPEIARMMVQKVLREAVRVGTGRRAEIPGYQVFGKTGTAQVARSDGRGYEPNAYVGSFLGGAPASKPEVVAIVSIRRPERRLGYYGGTVAAPAVKDILEAYFDYHHIPPFERPDGSPVTDQPIIHD